MNRIWIVVFLVFMNCNNRTGNLGGFKDDEKYLRTEILSDSLYQGKSYKLTIVTFDPIGKDEAVFNSVLTLAQERSENYQLIFRDSIYSSAREVVFADYNNDGVKDILVQNISDARSNWTYSLYLMDTTKNVVRKVKGFEEIKNPRFIAEFNVIDNYVNSGRNWTEFHTIKGDSVFNYGITLYDGEDDNGNATYESDYEAAIKRIMQERENSLTNNP